MFLDLLRNFERCPVISARERCKFLVKHEWIFPYHNFSRYEGKVHFYMKDGERALKNKKLTAHAFYTITFI